MGLLIRPSAGNAAKLISALHEFGFGVLDLSEVDFTRPGSVVQLGVVPYRIDLLTSISGLDFDDAWSDRRVGELEGIPIAFLSLRAFRINKRAAGRSKDLADLEDLPGD